MAYCIDLSNPSALLKALLKNIHVDDELREIILENEMEEC